MACVKTDIFHLTTEQLDEIRVPTSLWAHYEWRHYDWWLVKLPSASFSSTLTALRKAQLCRREMHKLSGCKRHSCVVSQFRQIAVSPVSKLSNIVFETTRYGMHHVLHQVSKLHKTTIGCIASKIRALNDQWLSSLRLRHRRILKE